MKNRGKSLVNFITWVTSRVERIALKVERTHWTWEGLRQHSTLLTSSREDSTTCECTHDHWHWVIVGVTHNESRGMETETTVWTQSWPCVLKNAVFVSMSEVERCCKLSHIQLSPLYLRYSRLYPWCHSCDKIHETLPAILCVGQRPHNTRVHVGKSLGTRLSTLLLNCLSCPAV